MKIGFFKCTVDSADMNKAADLVMARSDRFFLNVGSDRCHSLHEVVDTFLGDGGELVLYDMNTVDTDIEWAELLIKAVGRFDIRLVADNKLLMMSEHGEWSREWLRENIDDKKRTNDIQEIMLYVNMFDMKDKKAGRPPILKYDNVIQRINEGYSISAIADMHCVSQPAVSQMLKRRKRKDEMKGNEASID